MKLAPVSSLVVCLCLLSAWEVVAQRRLPNGQPVRRASQQLASLAFATQLQQTANAPAPLAQSSTPSAPAPSTITQSGQGAAPATPVTTTQTPQGIKVEVLVPLTGAMIPAPAPQAPRAPCTGLENGHDWMARADRAATVLRELLDATDRNMSQGVLNRSDCVAVIPSLKKAGLTVGGYWGRGVMSCRFDNKSWSPPVFFTVTGGSFGLQIGVQFTDLVMLIGNRSGADSLLSNKFEVGASASATALMMGRHAGLSSDILMNSRVVSYARSRGLFAGVELKGAYFRPDNMAHHVIYGDGAHVHDILSSEKIANDARAACF
ncbi:MAG TPA: lipid-binding SYLF domain-containing protein, partial [Blastocatellia bacterium]|nr:lipid-binding SYLF domain-containing protein [Blastocatellia bacterium]